MFSLIIPVFNEELLLDELLNRAIPAIETFTVNYELIFIDDGSTDKTMEKLLSFRKSNSRIKILTLSRNFGHQAALTAGLEHSKGDIVAMMDGDLQDPPELLAEMYAKITNEGFEVVNGIRTSRRGKAQRNFLTLVFHLVFRKISQLENLQNTGNFSMMKREALNALLSMSERIRYLPGMRTFIGYKQGEISFIRDARYSGKPKMNIRKLFALALDAIFAFSRLPIILCLWLGIFGILIFLGAGIYVLIAKAFGFAIPGWSSILLSIYFLGSIQLVFLGIIGEYIYRNYKESQKRPLYFVRKYYEGDISDR
jgi:dolichol-phosphate mannosyltransferase